LGQPLYSIVVTLATILVATGVGSFLSERWARPDATPKRAMLLVVSALAVLLLALVATAPALVDALVTLPTALRMAASALLVAPMGVLLGVPFAHGIAILQRQQPSLIPWAWAVNGSATVFGSIATVVLSMNAGFNVVMLSAIAIYLGAYLALPRAPYDGTRATGDALDSAAEQS
jgi:hypothetical protein